MLFTSACLLSAEWPPSGGPVQAITILAIITMGSGLFGWAAAVSAWPKDDAQNLPPEFWDDD